MIKIKNLDSMIGLFDMVLSEDFGEYNDEILISTGDLIEKFTKQYLETTEPETIKFFEVLLSQHLTSRIFNLIQNDNKKIQSKFIKIVNHISCYELNKCQKNNLINGGLYNCFSYIFNNDEYMDQKVIRDMLYSLQNLLKHDVILNEITCQPNLIEKILQIGLINMENQDQGSFLINIEIIYVIASIIYDEEGIKFLLQSQQLYQFLSEICIRLCQVLNFEEEIGHIIMIYQQIIEQSKSLNEINQRNYIYQNLIKYHIINVLETLDINSIVDEEQKGIAQQIYDYVHNY